MFQVDLYDALCRCLQLLPDDVIDQVIPGDLDPVTLTKVMYMRCYLVSVGSQPLAWMNPVLETALYSQQW